MIFDEVMYSKKVTWRVLKASKLMCLTPFYWGFLEDESGYCLKIYLIENGIEMILVGNLFK